MSARNSNASATAPSAASTTPTASAAQRPRPSRARRRQSSAAARGRGSSTAARSSTGSAAFWAASSGAAADARSRTAPRMATCARAVLGGGRRRGGGVDAAAPTSRVAGGRAEASEATRRPASAPRATAPDATSAATVRAAPSSAAIADQPGSSSARAISASPSGAPSARSRRASGRVNAVAAGPLAERLGGNRQPVHVDVAQERLAPHPAPPARRVHDLHEGAVHAPDDDEVNQPRRQPRHDDGGQRVGLGEQQVVDRHHHLLGVEAQAGAQRLQRVDRRSVDGGLAGLAQAAVADADAEPLEQALQRRGPAVHRRGLNHLRREESP